MPPSNQLSPSLGSMSAPDQKTKLRKRQLIETHWQCDIHDALPPQIRPREQTGRSTKAKIGTDAPEVEWWQWSIAFLTRLEKLASMTAGKLAFGQELVLLEVQRRQQDWTAKYKDVAEVVVGDLDRINKDLRERCGAIEAEVLEIESGEEAESVGDDVQKDMATKPEADAEESKIKLEPADGDFETIPNGCKQEDFAASAVAPLAKRSSLKAKAHVATLRADAMRLRQEAARREAEAYELEAKMLKAEARLCS